MQLKGFDLAALRRGAEDYAAAIRRLNAAAAKVPPLPDHTALLRLARGEVKAA